MYVCMYLCTFNDDLKSCVVVRGKVVLNHVHQVASIYLGREGGGREGEGGGRESEREGEGEREKGGRGERGRGEREGGNYLNTPTYPD